MVFFSGCLLGSLTTLIVMALVGINDESGGDDW
jgi:hypothetical protein